MFETQGESVHGTTLSPLLIENLILPPVLLYSTYPRSSIETNGPTPSPHGILIICSNSILRTTAPLKKWSIHSNGSSTQTFSVGGTASRFFLPQVEGTLGVSFLNFAPATTASPVLLVQAGPTYNLNSDIENSFFATVQAGIMWWNFTGSTPNITVFHYLAGVGKRFQIVDHVTWSPEFSVSGNPEATSTNSNGSNTLYSTFTWTISLFQFSVIF